MHAVEAKVAPAFYVPPPASAQDRRAQSACQTQAYVLGSIPQPDFPAHSQYRAAFPARISSIFRYSCSQSALYWAGCTPKRQGLQSLRALYRGIKRDEGGLSLSLGDRKESEKKQEDRIMTRHRIAASILSADFARLGEEARQVADAGADWIHFDVMDNHYVPNLTAGPMVCAALRKYSELPLDVHLMVRPVDQIAIEFAKAGAHIISFHPEASEHIDRTLALIHAHGCKAGLAFNPATPLHALDHVMERLDLILIMSVNPGFGGQAFIPEALNKLRAARAYRCLYPAHRPGNSPRNRWRGQRGQYRRHRDRRRRYFCCGFSNFQAARLSRRDSGDAQRARGLRRERSMTEMTPHLSCLAPAKLNLFLHITGRRPDGYHTLQTVFQLLDYGDTLHFRVRDDAVIRRATASLEVPEENDLAIRAARLLQTQSRCPLGVEIGIDKRVPIGAGLGGGSSDAACVLLALNRLWRLNLPRVQLQRLALSLGADVPFFVFGRNAFAEGIGERLHAIDLPNRYFLTVTPDVQAASADIFAAPELTRNTKIIKIADFLEQRRNPLWPDHFGRNDMQPLVAQKYAEVAHLLDRFGRIAPARMTGTGSSVFAAFKDKERADSVQSKLPQGMHSIVASGLAIHPLFTFSY